MRYRFLGPTGLRISELCLGAMTFGQARGPWGADRDESRAVFNRFIEAGGNFIDTANGYQLGQSEEFLAEFVGDQRKDYVLATKFTFGGQAHNPNSSGNHRKSMVQALEGSLRRLKTDYIDLYWMHAWDMVTPQDEVLRALDDLVRAGKILYIGYSDTPAWVVSRSQAIAELRGWTSLAAIQIPYSLIERTPERELLPMSAALGLSIAVWGALGSGFLSGKYKPGDKVDASQGRLGDPMFAGRNLNDRNFAIADEVKAVAKDLAATPSQVALAWTRAQSPFVVPIVGAKTLAQLEDNLGCLDLSLSAEHLERLNTASAIAMGFPHEFLRGEVIRSMMFGSKGPLIDAPTPRTRV
jgi:aryl-alcohol dehydrogenase-like predicted oxidoreductase